MILLQSTNEEICKAVEFAIDAGYRHFDCAWEYGNEAGVGEAIQKKIEDETVKREDLFITSKVSLVWLLLEILYILYFYCFASRFP